MEYCQLVPEVIQYICHSLERMDRPMTLTLEGFLCNQAAISLPQRLHSVLSRTTCSVQAVAPKWRGHTSFTCRNSMSAAHRLAQLEARLQGLQQHVTALIEARRGMLARERLLSAWCSGFSLLKDVAVSTCEDTEDWQRYQELEMLLQAAAEEMSLPAVYSHIDMELLPVTPAQPYGTIAPASDSVAYFRRVVLQPMSPAAVSITTPQLAQLLREVTMEALVQQHILQLTTPSEQGPVISKMQEIWDRYHHVVVSLYMLSRSHVVEALAVYNLETLSEDPEGAIQHEAVIESRIPQLQLSLQQQEAIAVGADLYHQRMRGILVSRQQVQSSSGSTVSSSATLAQNADSPVGSCGPSSYSAADEQLRSNTASSTSQPLAEPPHTLRERRQQMQATEQHVEQLGMLLREEGQLRVLTWGWLIGCLSWRQWTMLGAICWPYTVRPAVFARGVHAQWHSQMQAKQQKGIGASELPLKQ